jgi:hypothetical protein
MARSVVPPLIAWFAVVGVFNPAETWVIVGCPKLEPIQFGAVQFDDANMPMRTSRLCLRTHAV